jgi:hypothetical protein
VKTSITNVDMKGSTLVALMLFPISSRLGPRRGLPVWHDPNQIPAARAISKTIRIPRPINTAGITLRTTPTWLNPRWAFWLARRASWL